MTVIGRKQNVRLWWKADVETTGRTPCHDGSCVLCARCAHGTYGSVDERRCQPQ